MKHLIRKILKEHYEEEFDKWAILEMDLRKAMDQVIAKNKSNWGDSEYNVMSAIDGMFEDGFFQKVQSLWEQDETGEDQPNEEEENTPIEGEIGAGTYRVWEQLPSLEGTDKGKWTTTTPTISTKLFWSAVKQMVLNYDEETFEKYGDMSGNYEPYERYKEFEATLKLFGLNDSKYDPDSMFSKIFHTAVTNYEGIIDGTIQSFNDLKIPEVNKYELDMRQTVSEYVEYTWQIPITAYTPDDAEAEVYADEDGMYVWYEWDHSDGFHKEYLEEETQERDVEDIHKV